MSAMSAAERLRQAIARTGGGAVQADGVRVPGRPGNSRMDVLAELGYAAATMSNGRMAADIAVAVNTGTRLPQHVRMALRWWVLAEIEDGRLPRPRKNHVQVINHAVDIAESRAISGGKGLQYHDLGYSRDSARRALIPISDAVERQIVNLESAIVSQVLALRRKPTAK